MGAPGVGGPSPCTHLEPALASVSCTGHLPALRGSGTDDPFLPLMPHVPGGALWRQCPASRQEASAPSLVPSAGPHPLLPPPKHTTAQAAPTSPGESKGMRLQGLGVTRGWVRGPQEPCFPPAHRDIRVTLKGSLGNLPPCRVPQPGCDPPTHPWFPETEEEGMGLPGGLAQGAQPGLCCVT
ncbi:hypothetical protein VULLAG_LOCUS5188 [Vulpes lagopus]